jgi:hypothetical protein
MFQYTSVLYILPCIRVQRGLAVYKNKNICEAWYKFVKLLCDFLEILLDFATSICSLLKYLNLIKIFKKLFSIFFRIYAYQLSDQELTR